MPKAKRKPCTFGGCTRLTFDTRCDRHTKVRPKASPERAKRQSMYNNESWKTLRKFILTNYPLCRECDQLASVVDHIQPHRGDEALFWDTSNLQPLCKSCHDQKTRRGE